MRAEEPRPVGQQSLWVLELSVAIEIVLEGSIDRSGNMPRNRVEGFLETSEATLSPCIYKNEARVPEAVNDSLQVDP